jgi:hypothetical protein
MRHGEKDGTFHSMKLIFESGLALTLLSSIEDEHTQ